jgi:hypothetical protein
MTLTSTNDRSIALGRNTRHRISIENSLPAEGLELEGVAKPLLPSGVACRAVVPRLRDEGGRHLGIFAGAAEIKSRLQTSNAQHPSPLNREQAPNVE